LKNKRIIILLILNIPEFPPIEIFFEVSDPEEDKMEEIEKLFQSKIEKDVKVGLELINVSLSSEKKYQENLEKLLSILPLKSIFNVLETSNDDIIELSLSALTKIFKKKSFTVKFLKEEVNFKIFQLSGIQIPLIWNET
jgi:hypothetical protein